MLPAALGTLRLLCLCSVIPRVRVPACCDHQGQDEQQLVAHAAAGEKVDLGSSMRDAAERLAALEERAANRLKEMGASEAIAAPEDEERRSEFAISNAAARRKESEEQLHRMRAKDRGELEEGNRKQIAQARDMAKQWLTAGLPARAEQELQAVAKFVSYRSELGGLFHLELADVLKVTGREMAAMQLLQRILKSSESSSIRWQAERKLQERSLRGPSNKPKPGNMANPEMGRLFQMPSSWD